MVIFRRISTLLFTIVLLQSCASTPIQGPTLSLQHLVADSKATVFIWWATQCPCVARYESRIEALVRDFEPKGIRFHIISSNSDDDRGRVESIAQKRKFSLPILADAGGRLAEELEARTTPTVVIVDNHKKVLYRGWIDNERRAGENGRIAYVENALREIVEDKGVSNASSPIYGCRITKRLR